MPRSRRALSGDEQGALLRLAFPSFRQVARGNPWVWIGTLIPTGCSYRVRIAYHPTLARPRVSVVTPRLVRRVASERIPHTFTDDRICVHLNDEWNSSMPICRTIVPWTVLWLYYYEVWHATGEWLGGGHEFHNDEVATAEEVAAP